jgi:hypothetical protein
MEMLTTTFFTSLKNTKPSKFCTLEEIFEIIKSEKYKSIVSKIREEELPSKSILKNKIPVFTPTGIFNHRSIKGLEIYNGIICLDLDGVENPNDLKERCKQLDYVYAAFITPSGKGLKVIIKTSSLKDDYKITEEIVSKRFFEDTGFMRDNHCKDIARIQFLSYDPYLYCNQYSESINI